MSRHARVPRQLASLARTPRACRAPQVLCSRARPDRRSGVRRPRARCRFRPPRARLCGGCGPSAGRLRYPLSRCRPVSRSRWPCAHRPGARAGVDDRGVARPRRAHALASRPRHESVLRRPQCEAHARARRPAWPCPSRWLGLPPRPGRVRIARSILRSASAGVCWRTTNMSRVWSVFDDIKRPPLRTASWARSASRHAVCSTSPSAWGREPPISGDACPRLVPG